MSNKLKPYEYIDKINQVVCIQHEKMVCSECEYEYVKGLETEIEHRQQTSVSNYLAYQEKLTQIEELEYKLKTRDGALEHIIRVGFDPVSTGDISHSYSLEANIARKELNND